MSELKEADTFEIPMMLWSSLRQVIDTHHPYKITGRPSTVEGLAGMVVTLWCDAQRDGEYVVRYLCVGSAAPIQLP